MNYYQFFKNTVFRFPEKTAMVFQNKQYSYREFDERICRLASVMKMYQIEKGKRVGVICSNGNAYVEIILAASMLGAVSEQFNWRTSMEGMAELLEESASELVFVTADFIHHYNYLRESLKRSVTLILIDGEDTEALSYEKLLADAPVNETIEELDYYDPQFIFYTSGTTSKPKRVLLSIGSVFQHNMALLYEIGWKTDERYLHYLPLFHTASGGVYCTLFTGGTVTLLTRFEMESWLSTVQEQKITACGMVPNVIAWLIEHPDFDKRKLSSLRWMVYAGGPMPYPVLKKAIDRVGCIFFQLYGMTEMCPTIAILKPKDHLRYLETGEIPNGRPMIGNCLAIFDENDQPCGPYETGEVVVRGNQMMLGYDGQPELTAKVMRGGWYHTSDLGYMDENRYLYLVGRKNRMIISGGENVYPSQVESCIRTMGDEIRDVAVIGIPSEKWGEAVAAVIVLQKGCTWNEETIIHYCQDHLPGYMKPRYIQFVDKIAHNENGKVIYQVLKDLF